MTKKQNPDAVAPAQTEINPAAEVAQTEITGADVAPAQTEIKAPVVKDIRNGVLRPVHLGIVGKLWAFFESASLKNESAVQRAEVLAWATENGFKHSTATAQHARWRKYYGLSNDKAKSAEAAAAKAAEAATAKAAKAAAKAAKEQAKKDKAEQAAAAVATATPDISIETDNSSIETDNSHSDLDVDPEEEIS